MAQFISTAVAPPRHAAPHFHRHIILTTFDQEGTPLQTMDWFAAVQDKLYVRAQIHSSTAQHIKRTARILVAPASVTGQQRGLTVVGAARILPQLVSHTAERAIATKYGLLSGANRLKEDFIYSNDHIMIEITLDPGPGSADLLLEAIPNEQRIREIVRNVAIGAGALLALGGVLILLRRIFRSVVA
jgi:PPOX class probable F420-dependent enzyme